VKDVIGLESQSVDAHLDDRDLQDQERAQIFIYLPDFLGGQVFGEGHFHLRVGSLQGYVQVAIGYYHGEIVQVGVDNCIPQAESLSEIFTLDVIVQLKVPVGHDTHEDKDPKKEEASADLYAPDDLIFFRLECDH
jgi:hypothetical protein